MVDFFFSWLKSIPGFFKWQRLGQACYVLQPIKYGGRNVPIRSLNLLFSWNSDAILQASLRELAKNQSAVEATILEQIPRNQKK